MQQHPFVIYRKEAGLTQQQLAERIGVSRNLVALIEIGRRRVTAENALAWSAQIPLSKEVLCPEIFGASAGGPA